MDLNIMTFNLRIHVLGDGDNAWPNRVTGAADAIRQSNADIVCTQEGSIAMLQDLQRLLPDYRWLGVSRGGAADDEYCAIFYKQASLEPIESGHFSLSENPEQLGLKSWDAGCPRMCTWAKFVGKDDAAWFVYNTHLDHLSEQARDNGIQLILARMKDHAQRSPLPFVLTGDFNCEPSSNVIALVEQAGFQSAYSVIEEPHGRTYHAYEGGESGYPIDYIFVSPNARIASAFIDRNIYNGRYPSDHYPVLAVVSPA
ncbi:endonuclease/exonuclease/phosphatase family protein [Paenibacillus rhizovicinus]|uniref:Endonuclease/exonuclease/phosphatase family protein n=1 Tax=Paenibacillus rhizovicinus TaxID=2704463 RepID=A0A6C0P801_9BACL|nr:endonuclease/exonuclease/phosphatase family protein [Paenibacillus rhizovicinus]QHW34684.1 endonuclease/exonuclease/phosphatase family protein [Paenibacillus rhizovicinus]